jgi:Uma2 family endonuclease
MNTMKKETEKHFTYEDLVSWDDNVRYELVHGVPRALAAPLLTHQKLARRLSTAIDNFLRGKPCELFFAPADVKLFPEDNDFIYQPDLFVVCDKKKIEDGKACKGAPDLVIEILSPSTLQIDKIEKFNNYLKAGVREYWIVDPERYLVDVFMLENGKYISYAYGEKDTLKSQVLKDCKIKLAEVFAED